jgi:hypothetical protein
VPPLVVPVIVVLVPKGMVRSGPAFTWGKALTVTARLTGVPVQNVGAGPIGVIIYVTTISFVVRFVRISPIVDVKPLAGGLLMPATEALDQENVAEGISEVIVYVNGWSLQTAEMRLLVTDGIGLTVVT